MRQFGQGEKVLMFFRKLFIVLINKALVIYFGIAGIEFFFGVLYYLTLPLNTTQDRWAVLGYPITRLFLIFGLLAALLFSFFMGYHAWRGSGKLELWLNTILNDDPTYQGVLRWLTVFLLLSSVCSLLNANILGALIYYYIRVQPILVLITLLTFQSLVWFLILYYYHTENINRVWLNTKLALGLEGSLKAQEKTEGKVHSKVVILIQSIPRVWLALINLFLLFLGIWLVLYNYAGGPQSWDEMRYMYLSMHPEPDPGILNRYFHIYFQKAFFYLAGNDPFLGVKLFWSFLIALTTMLIVINTKYFTPWGNWLLGFFPLLFFYAQPRILPFAGVTYADYTAMTMLTLSLTWYIGSFRSSRYQYLFLALLGMTMFFAYKSTDNGIFSTVYLLGLGFSQGENRFIIERWLKRAGVVLLGLLIGQIVLMFLDQIFLGDAFFSLRASSWASLIQVNFGAGGKRFIDLLSKNLWILILFTMFVLGVGVLFFALERKGKDGMQVNLFGRVITLTPTKVIFFIGIVIPFMALYVPLTMRNLDFLINNVKNWLTILIPITGLPFLLFVLSLVKLRKNKWKAYQIVCWLYPITLLMFLISFAGVNRRYFLPALPLILILSAQVFDKQPSSGSIGWGNTVMKVLLPSIIIASIGITSIVIIPTAIPVAVIILCVLLVKQEKPLPFAILLTCAILFTFPQIIYYGKPFVMGNQALISERRFSPLEISSRYVTCGREPYVFVSGNIFSEYGVLSQYQSSLRYMFNLYFRCSLESSHFNMTTNSQGGVELPSKLLDENVASLLSGDYTYIYLSAKDWDEFSDSAKQTLENQYKVIFATWQPEQRIRDFRVQYQGTSHVKAKIPKRLTLSSRNQGQPQYLATTWGKADRFGINAPIHIVFLYK